jgi:hypothetical protein
MIISKIGSIKTTPAILTKIDRRYKPPLEAVSDTIDSGKATDPQVSTGPSAYGVWERVRFY